jgi:hypothetical protein
MNALGIESPQQLNERELKIAELGACHQALAIVVNEEKLIQEAKSKEKK